MVMLVTILFSYNFFLISTTAFAIDYKELEKLFDELPRHTSQLESALRCFISLDGVKELF